MGARRPRWRRLIVMAALALVALGAAIAPWWGPRALAPLRFFELQRVAVEGVRYLDPAVVTRHLALRSHASVWDPVLPLVDRVRQDPLVTAATIERELPGTLVIHVVENPPVALLATAQGVQPVDRRGRVLPLDPVQTPMDLPLLSAPDTALTRFLGDLAVVDPALYARVNDVAPLPGGEALLHVGAIPIRARHDLSAARVRDVGPVLLDLARRRAPLIDLDLRFRDQTIAHVR